MTGLAAVEEALYAALAESRGSALDEVRADVGSDGQIDSLEGIELALVAEERFGVHVDDSELTPATCSSIPKLAQLVASKIGTEGAAGGGADERA